MRVRRFVSGSCAVLALLISARAFAQSRSSGAASVPGKPAAKLGPLRRAQDTGHLGDLARKKALAGDCLHALDLFDQSILSTADPVLKRDRGRCHEILGNVYPAIDDYRAYLSEMPSAPDSDEIREHLAALQGAPPPSNQSSETTPADETRNFERLEREQRSSDAAKTSPTRLSKGFALGGYIGFEKLVNSEAGSSDLGGRIGGTLRYAFSPGWVGHVDLGYVAYGRGGSPNSVSGVQLFLGAEYRAALDTNADHQLYFGLSTGFDNVTTASTPGSTTLLALPRGRAGYRHIFGTAFAVELGLEGGVLYAPAQHRAPSSTLGFFGATLGAAVGF